MSVYVIASLTIKCRSVRGIDTDGRANLEKYDGRFIARGGPIKATPPRRLANRRLNPLASVWLMQFQQNNT